MNIKKLINNFRIKSSYFKHGINYSKNITDVFFEQYIGHSKIINWQNGYPVYSCMIPPLFTKVSSRLLGLTYFGLNFEKNIPYQANIAINDICNAYCKHCSFFENIHNKKKINLTKKEYIKLVDDLIESGVCHFAFVGGEPLLNQDLFEIINSINFNKSFASIFTNGYLISKNFEKIKKSKINNILISIDDYDLDKHEEKRGIKGLKNEILNGIKLLKKTSITLGMSIYLFEKDYEKISNYMELAKKLGFHEVIIFPAFPVGRLKNCNTNISEDSFNLLKQEVKKYNNDINYPGIYFYKGITSINGIGCQGGKKYIYISPYGDLMHCDFYNEVYGNIKEEKVSNILNKSLIINKGFDTCKFKKLLNEQRKI